jgi:hypothetical protein
MEEIRTIRGQEARITFLRLDNGTEYMTDNLKELLKKEKITLDKSPPYTSDLNGTAERFNLEIQQKIRCVLFDSRFPLQMWAYALQFILTVYNRTPRKALRGKIPYEEMFRKPCTVKYFRRFGCACYFLDTKARAKFGDRSVDGFLVGCADTHYLIIDPHTGKVYRSKNVRFTESKTYGDIYVRENKTTVLTDPPVSSQDEGRKFFYPTDEESVEKTTPNETLRDAREKFSLLCGDFCSENNAYEAYNINVDDEPETYGNAKQSLGWDDWRKAVEDEFNSHFKNETWKIIKRSEVPSSQAIMSSKWIFKRKEVANGEKIYKARLVVRGFSDKNIYDRTEVYAPVARLTDVRFFLSMVNKYKLILTYIDVKTAFLNGLLEKEAYNYGDT